MRCNIFNVFKWLLHFLCWEFCNISQNDNWWFTLLCQFTSRPKLISLLPPHSSPLEDVDKLLKSTHSVPATSTWKSLGTSLVNLSWHTPLPEVNSVTLLKSKGGLVVSMMNSRLNFTFSQLNTKSNVERHHISIEEFQCIIGWADGVSKESKSSGNLYLVGNCWVDGILPNRKFLNCGCYFLRPDWVALLEPRKNGWTVSGCQDAIPENIEGEELCVPKFVCAVCGTY